MTANTLHVEDKYGSVDKRLLHTDTLQMGTTATRAIVYPTVRMLTDTAVMPKLQHIEQMCVGTRCLFENCELSCPAHLAATDHKHTEHKQEMKVRQTA